MCKTMISMGDFKPLSTRRPFKNVWWALDHLRQSKTAIPFSQYKTERQRVASQSLAGRSAEKVLLWKKSCLNMLHRVRMYFLCVVLIFANVRFERLQMSSGSFDQLTPSPRSIRCIGDSCCPDGSSGASEPLGASFRRRVTWHATPILLRPTFKKKSAKRCHICI